MLIALNSIQFEMQIYNKLYFRFRWQWLIGYNVVVIFFKTFTQILGCIFINDMPESMLWFVNFFGIGCVRKFVSSDPDVIIARSDQTGIAWDAVCFAFLIFQKRIFNSFNFFHIVDESKATTILASRGKKFLLILIY